MGQATIILLVSNVDRTQWGTIKSQLKTFLQNNPQFTLAEPPLYVEKDPL